MPQADADTGEPLAPHGAIVDPDCVHEASGGTSPGKPAYAPQFAARAGAIIPDQAWPKQGTESKKKQNRNFLIVEALF